MHCSLSYLNYVGIIVNYFFLFADGTKSSDGLTNLTNVSCLIDEDCALKNYNTAPSSAIVNPAYCKSEQRPLKSKAFIVC